MEGDTGNESMVSNQRGEKLFWKSWPCSDNKPSKLVFVCHGFGEHCHRYLPMIKQLVEKGFHVFAHDHVGHGKSEGDRVHIDNFKFYIDDVVQHVDEVKKTFPDIPCFIVGHSMGGAITILTCLDHPDLFKGAVIIGPALVLNPNAATPFKMFMAKLLSSIAPQFQVGKLIPEHYTRNKEQVQLILADPLCWHEGIKTRMGTQIMAAMSEIEQRRSELKVPYLLIHGSDDFICEISGSEAFHQHTSSSDKTFTPYKGAYHQVHWEPEGQAEKCIAEICAWILAR